MFSVRGRAAFDAIGILNQFKGTLVRDGWFSYKKYEQCRHRLCNAQLLRNLVYVGEAEPPHKDWTDVLAKLLIEIKDTMEQHGTIRKLNWKAIYEAIFSTARSANESGGRSRARITLAESGRTNRAEPIE